MTADNVRKKERPNGMNSALFVLITFLCDVYIFRFRSIYKKKILNLK